CLVAALIVVAGPRMAAAQVRDTTTPVKAPADSFLLLVATRDTADIHRDITAAVQRRTQAEEAIQRFNELRSGTQLHVDEMKRRIDGIKDRVNAAKKEKRDADRVRLEAERKAAERQKEMLERHVDLRTAEVDLQKKRAEAAELERKALELEV